VSALDGIKEKLKDQWADLSSKIQENSTFNNLREKFEAQSPTIQRAIIAGASVLAVFVLLQLPWSYISESQQHMADFEDNRGLIQGLLRASRAAKEPSPLPTPASVDAMRSRVEGIMKENRLVPEQVGEITPLPANPAKDFAPPVVVQTGLAIQIKKLNLDQITSLGHQFQNLGPGSKLMGLDIIQSPGETHYYDMIARVVTFALPVMTFEEQPETKKGAKGAKKPSRSTEEEPAE
jgi:hypothetical protein